MSWLERPILFLDVDGVLNSHDYIDRGGSLNCRTGGIDPEAVKHLQRIVDETGCSLVLSSTWRTIYSLADFRGRLIEAGMRHPVPLRSKTPVLDSVYKDTKLVVARIRGDEVREWIDNAGFEGRYVCLDDDADFHPDQPLVKTTFRHGLTAEHADQCIKILLGDPTKWDGPTHTCIDNKTHIGAKDRCDRCNAVTEGASRD